MKKDDIIFIVNAIKFIAQFGHLFLLKYEFDINTGEWNYIDFKDIYPEFSIENEFLADKIDISNLKNIRDSYFTEAEKIAIKLKKSFDNSFNKDEEDIEDLKYFYYHNKSLNIKK